MAETLILRNRQMQALVAKLAASAEKGDSKSLFDGWVGDKDDPNSLFDHIFGPKKSKFGD